MSNVPLFTLRGILLIVLVLGISCVQDNSLPVKQGSQFHEPPTQNEGFGTQTRGGLDGKSIKVTNLSSAGSGSLRAALEAPGKRVIVFEVGGLIWLDKDLLIRRPFVTIAGETAPLPGITIANGTLNIQTHDVVARHLRIRVGDDPSGSNPDNRDGISIAASKDGSIAAYNVVIDHCSVSWAIDEGVATYSPHLHDVTIRNSIVAENLSKSLHSKGGHSMGLLIGDKVKRVAVIGNLLAHNLDRNPLIKGGGSGVVLNNLIYNPSRAAVYMNDDRDGGPAKANLIGNEFRLGVDTKSNEEFFRSNHMLSGTEVYLKDNKLPNGFLVDINGYNPIVSQPVDFGVSFTVRPTSEVADFVLRNAGARPADRDAVDARIVDEVRTGTGWIIDSQEEVGGWPNYASTHHTLDLPGNPQGDADGDGRNNLEEWLDGYRAVVEGW